MIVDRRKFITRTSGAVLGVAASQVPSKGQWIYGTPNPQGLRSVVPDGAHLLKLHLVLEGTEESQFDHFLALAQLASDVLEDAGVAAAFSANPRDYFARAGFPNVEIDTESVEFRLTLALADPAVRQAALSGDGVKYLQALKEYGFGAMDTTPQQTSGTTWIWYYGYYAVVYVTIVAVLLALVAIAVAPAEDPKSPELELAGALGGKTLAYDVVKAQATERANAMIADILDDKVELPPGVTKEEMIGRIRSALAKHMP
jgi:hypothetical protein